jgi:hypothetical protein
MLAHVDNSVDVEGDLLGVGSPGLVTKAVNIFSIMLGCERVVAVGDTLLVCLVLTSRVGDLSKLASRPDTQQVPSLNTYPEIDIKVACATKFTIANLEGHGHGVILVEGLVEAFSTVGG